jgi:hypothetical protein
VKKHSILDDGTCLNRDHDRGLGEDVGDLTGYPERGEMTRREKAVRRGRVS